MCALETLEKLGFLSMSVKTLEIALIQFETRSIPRSGTR